MLNGDQIRNNTADKDTPSVIGIKEIRRPHDCVVNGEFQSPYFVILYYITGRGETDRGNRMTTVGLANSFKYDMD